MSVKFIILFVYLIGCLVSFIRFKYEIADAHASWFKHFGTLIDRDERPILVLAIIATIFSFFGIAVVKWIIRKTFIQ